MNKKISNFSVSLITVVMLFCGVIISSNQVFAAVTADLPKTPGLYVSEYIDWEGDKVLTDTDASNNVIPVNHNKEVIRWRDQDNPEYLTKGMQANDPEHYWGMGFDNKQTVWFDYIANGKVTHVNAGDINITNLDGTACNDISIEADENDKRLCIFTMHVSEKKVMISYKNDDNLVNSKFVADFSLRTGFYKTDEMKVDTFIVDDQNVIRGKSKDIYFHMTDNWDEAAFELEESNPVSIRYWDREKNNEVELTGDQVNNYVTLTKVSEADKKNHVICKLTVNGVDTIDDYEIIVNYMRYNINEPENVQHDERRTHIRLIDVNELYVASPESLTVKGNEYIYSNNAEYRNNGYFAAESLYKPIYMEFKYCDENGEMKPVEDVSKLSFFSIRWSDEEDKEIITKVGSDVIKAEKPYTDSNIIKISYVGDTTEDLNRWNEFIVTYGEKIPEKRDAGGFIELAFVTSDNNEVGSYNSTEINEQTYSKEFTTDGTADINIYTATLDLSEATPWNYVESAKISSVELTDENGNDLSSKVTYSGAQLSRNEEPALEYSEKVVIPKGTLNASAKLRINVTARCNHRVNPDSDERAVNDENYSLDVYIFYTPHTHKAGTEWKSDKDAHWHECIAGDEALLDKAAHSWDGGVITIQPTTDKEGVKTYTCTVCKTTKTETIAKLPAQSSDTQTTTEQKPAEQTTTEQKPADVPKVEPIKEGDKKVDESGATYVVTETTANGITEVEYSAPETTDTKVTVPSTVEINGVVASVTSISDNAFSGNKNITEVKLPDTVVTIGANSFKGCTKLKTVTISDKVETISSGAFSGCTFLSKITIPKNVKVISKNAFSGNKKLKTITIKSTKIKTFGKNAFKNLSKKAVIKVPKKVKKSYTKLIKKSGFKGKIK